MRIPTIETVQLVLDLPARHTQPVARATRNRLAPALRAVGRHLSESLVSHHVAHRRHVALHG